MSEKRRPVALLTYCALLAAFVVWGAGYGVYRLLAPAAQAPNVADFVFAFVPPVMLSAGLVGLWLMRWWALAFFWLCILSMIVMMLLVPFRGPIDPFLSALAMNVAIWVALFALPPTVLAIAYRRNFR